MQRQEDTTNSNKVNVNQPEDDESTSDYKQWLHAMKLVARLPGGIPPEFRRKLWLSLADKYLKSKNVDWSKEEEKCFCEKWREDDEELGIQIVKDLHRTGSTLCTGPAGDINQAKLKRILLGYARYNPEVGYCQGFNMLGALILQVMDKDETESMKVMIYLVEGILPPGYFCGSMGGLQADMAVFRELMQTKLPKLARHLQKLQGPVENAYEPPLTNVFTMQWFLTMFCTCLPMSCVLRVWDLVLIEGSDVLLRTALALWSLLEDRVLSTRSADDFYGKMGSFSSELLNGHLIDSNGLIEKVVQLGPIQDIQKLRDKHLYSVSPLKNKQGLNLYYDDEEPDMDEDSRLAVATVWGIPWGRRGSQGQTSAKQAAESKDRIALDISLLKKQYDRLRERQKQAHIILTTACSTARQTTANSAATIPVNQLLSGRPAIVTNRGRRTGPPPGAIPPARKPSLPAVLQDNKPIGRQLRRGETLQWRDNVTDPKRRRDSLTWKEIRAERAAMLSSGSIDGLKSQKIRTKRLGKSDSSSYSEESEDDDKAASSSDTSLCDDDNPPSKSARKYASKAALIKQRRLTAESADTANRQRPKSWAPSNSEIPFVLMTTDSPSHSADEEMAKKASLPESYLELSKKLDEEDEGEEEEEEAENSATESDQLQMGKINGAPYSPLANEDLADVASKVQPLLIESESIAPPSSTDIRHIPAVPITDVVDILAISKVLANPTEFSNEPMNSLGSNEGEAEETRSFGVSDEGVTNQYFERVNSSERPTKLELMYSLNEEDSIRDAYKDESKDVSRDDVVRKEEDPLEKENQSRRMDILVDYSEKSSAACIAEAKTEISSTLQKSEVTQEPVKPPAYVSSAAAKRRDPRRLTLTRSTTMEIEERYQALEKRMSMEATSKYGSVAKKEDENLGEEGKHHTYAMNGRIPSEKLDVETKSIKREQGEGIQREHFHLPSFPKYPMEHGGDITKNRPISGSYANGDGTYHRYHMPSTEQKSMDLEEYATYHSRETLSKRREDEVKNKNHDLEEYRSIHSRDHLSQREEVKYGRHEPEEYRSYHSMTNAPKREEDIKYKSSNAEEYKSYHLIENPSRRKEQGEEVSKYKSQHHETYKYRPYSKEDYSRSRYSFSSAELLKDPKISRSYHSNRISLDEEKLSSFFEDAENHRPHPIESNRLSRLESHYKTQSKSYDKTPPSSKKPDLLSDVQRKPVIPSTADLEERFENMIRDRSKQASEEVSDSEKGHSSRKSPPSARENPQRDSKREGNKPSQSSNKNGDVGSREDVTSQGKQSDRESEYGEEEDNPEEDAEGEEEYGEEEEEDIPDGRASRAFSSVPKSSTRQRKKEPPDSEENELSERGSEVPDKSQSQDPLSDEEDRSVTVSGHDSPVEDSEPELGEEEEEEEEEPQPTQSRRQSDLKISRRPSEQAAAHTTSASSRRQSQLSVYSRRQSHSTDDREIDDRRSSRASRKSPPSTEELEKRFEALEKQMSITRSEASEDALEEHPHRYRAVEYDDRQSPDGYSELDQQQQQQQQLEDDSQRSANESETAEDEDAVRANRIKANVIEAMKASTSAMASDDDEASDTGRQQRMAANVREAMRKSKATTKGDEEEEEDASEQEERTRRSNKLKLDVLEAMKSALPSPEEDSHSMAAQVKKAMKSSATRHTEGRGEPMERQPRSTKDDSSKMASSVMDAMKSAGAKQQRSDKIKANIISAMKSSGDLESPHKEENPDEGEEEKSSSKMASNVMAAMKSSSRSDKIKAGIIASMKAATTPDEPAAETPTEEPTRKLSRSEKIRAGIIASMKSAATTPDEPAQTPTEEMGRKLSRSEKIKAGIIASMKSGGPADEPEAATPTEETNQKLSKSDRIKAGIIASMKTATTPEEPAQTPTEEMGRKQSRSDKIKAGIIASMKSATTPDEPAQTPTEEMGRKLSRSEKIKAGIIASMKSGSTPDEPEAETPTEEASKKSSRSDKIKAGIIASMKSGSTPDEPKAETPSEDSAKKISRSDRIKAGIIASMKSATTPEEPEAETPTEEANKKSSRSDKIKAGIIASMKSGSTTDEPKEETPTEESAKKLSRSDKIKAGIIASMKSGTTPEEPTPETPSKSQRTLASQPSEDGEKKKRSNKIKADVISAMKPSSDPAEGKMATNVMAAMKSSAQHSQEKVKRANKMKADVIEAMKPPEETQKQRSHKMATNVMETMKSSVKRKEESGDKPTKHRQSPGDEESTAKQKRSQKIKADVIDAMKSSTQTPEERSTKMATNVMETMKSRRTAAETSSKQKTKTAEVAEKKAATKISPTSSAASSRRSSEPPSTEDLEKRYEVLKRRMSSRKDSLHESQSQVKPKTSPPSTDSLERRFEKLQSNKTISADSKEKKSKVSESPKAIPSPPTPPKDWSETEQSSPSQEPSTRSALIEELQAKMGPTPNGENIKPSSINPNRKTPALLRKSKTDETSETHANAHANSPSGKRYEPLLYTNRKMVRRFSDLPSRADLENRLQFLEEQLNRTLLKQRRASDSEVASTSHRHQRLQPIKPLSATNRHVGKLESRVLELERQLGASAKFKSTLSTESQDQRSGPLENSAELSSSQMDLEIRADSVNVTGKELVRYNNYGELQEQDFQSPINISINIHMTLSKEELGKAATQSLTRAEELSRRLLILEEQLKNSQRIIASAVTPIDAQVQLSRELGAPSAQNEAEIVVEQLPPESGQQNDEGEDEIVINEESKASEEVIKEVPKETEEVRETPKEVEAEEVMPPPKEVEKLESKKEDLQCPDLAKEAKQEDLPTEKPREKEMPTEPLDKPIADKSERPSKEDDFDRRLQILEEHIKHSKPIKAPETHEPKMEKDKDKIEAKTEKVEREEEKKEEKSTEKAEESKVEKENVKAKEKEKESKELTEENQKDSSNKTDKPEIKDSSTSVKPKDEIPKTEETPKHTEENKAQIPEKVIGNLHGTQMVPVEVNKKTLVLLLDNEPKAVKVRRLTRANTEELEDLFQALEKQLLERGQIKPDDVGAKDQKSAQEMADLTKEIMQFSKTAKEEAATAETSPKKKATSKPPEEDFDWGKDPVKHHLRKKTVYLPSTRELESRFRSLERQIKMLEDVEKIDVEQRLTEIERKIKLQYSLSHEKDLNRFLDLCEGKGLDDIPPVGSGETPGSERCSSSQSQHQQQQQHSCTTHTKKHQSPVRFAEPECCDHHCHCTATAVAKKKEHQSPVRSGGSPQHSASKPTTEDLEYRFRALDLNRKSRPRTKAEPKREPIHPLEMLLDPSPEDIPTTGELEHRMKMLEEGRTPSPAALKSHSKSPVASQREASGQQQQVNEQPSSPSGLPTAQQLEARLEALEREQRFDFKMQKNYKEFNQKLKDIISPSLSFEEFRATRSSSAESAKRNLSSHRSPSPKVAVAQCTGDAATCPNKTIRFHDDDEQPSASQHHQSQARTRGHDSESMKTITDTLGATTTLPSVPPHLASSVQEGLGVMGIRLMRETSPLRRKGTHTGVPLRTGENINDQLTSIRSTIKSIDSLCEEKPYRTERCLQYIDSLCSDSNYFASKKSSYDDLRSRHSSRSRSRDPYGGPSIRISDQSSAYMRTMGSADSIRSSSPLRATSPSLQYHSNRDLRREISPRRRRTDEDREENESRVRRDNLLPNSLYYPYNHSSLSPSSHSLTKFHKVDSQLIATNDDVDCIDVEIQQIYGQATTTTATSTAAMSIQDTNNTNTSSSTNANNHTQLNTTTPGATFGLDRPISAYRQLGISRSNTPVYTPAKLEIRHTTVTSTFYDRVLTEKQLEKKHSQNSITATSNGTTTTTNGSTTATTIAPTTTSAQRSPMLEQPPVLVKPLDILSPAKFSVSETTTSVTVTGTVAAAATSEAAPALPPYAAFVGIDSTSLTDSLPTISSLPPAAVITTDIGSLPVKEK
uniref:TBC1 domain family member 30 n=1 Tax=Musca domestica TaxID=7370 RepID=A0A1I8MIT1_MUSDO